MYGAEVELDTLSDTDRAGTKYQYLFLRVCLYDFILAAKAGIIVRCGRFKFCRAGIYHLERCGDTVSVTHLFDVLFGFSGQFRDHFVRELDAFCFF